MTDADGHDRHETPPQRAGRVRHGHDGRAVWEWAVETGRHALESTSRLLKRLDMPGLSLEEEKEKEREPADDTRRGAGRDATGDAGRIPTFGGPREADPLAGSRRNFDPYDSRAPARRPASAPPRAGARPAPSKPLPQARKPGFLARLFGRR